MIRRDKCCSLDFFVKLGLILSSVFILVASNGRADSILGQTDSLHKTHEDPLTKNDKTYYGRYILLAAGGGLAFAFDRDINSLSQKSWFHSSASDKFLDRIEWMGREAPYYSAIPAFVGHGLIFRSEKSLLVGAELAAGLFTVRYITQGVKRGFGRKRPYQSNSPYGFFESGSAFHSGHTATVFTLATIISSNYPEQDLSFLGIDGDFPLVPFVAYSVAGMVGIQRMYSNVHWGSDVYFGALAGYGIGRLTIYLGEKTDIHIF
jgi:membrane-associated phospholipid phosphatase